MNKSMSLIITVVATSLMSLSALASERAEQGWRLIEQGAMIVDVRTPAEFSQGHIVDAVNFPLSDLEKHFKEIDKNQMIVLYCRSGNRSDKAYQYLQSQGFTNLHNAGGFDELIHVK